MNRTRSIATAALSTLALFAGAGAASATPLDHGTFHDEFSSLRSCDNGLELRVDTVNDGKFVVIRRGAGSWGYGVEHWDEVFTVTNVATGESYVGINKGLAGHDLRLVDNGDGTQTLYTISPAAIRIYAPDGHVAYAATGLATYTFLVDGDDVEFLGTDSFHGHDNLISTCDVAASFWL